MIDSTVFTVTRDVAWPAKAGAGTALTDEGAVREAFEAFGTLLADSLHRIAGRSAADPHVAGQGSRATLGTAL